MADTDLKQRIIAASQTIGIDKIGFTTAAPFSELAPSLAAQRAKGYSSGFEHQNIDERVHPDKIFDQPRSIIAIALAYPSRMHERAPRSEYKRGYFARASWGIDYHTILREKMTRLIAEIKRLAGEDAAVNFKPMVDTGELVDVAVAQRAGLGFIGKNGLLITKEFGSWVYLGEIITNIEFAPDTPIPCQCGDCTRCIDFCPPGALLGDGHLNAQRCLSYQTQTKGMMPAEYRPMIRNVIYGCDICQLVCPFNKGKDTARHPEMTPDPDRVSPELVPMLTMSNKEFKNRFGALAGAWRGKKPLQRNAIIALANTRDRSALPKLLEVIDKDPRPVIRGTAAWAVSQLLKNQNPEISAFLTAALAKETDLAAQTEFRDALAHIAALPA
ncbi:tRNA epoxyqueuosine(34) reductase QueG [Schleiferilactobacillus shenzhenensis]|uniref:YhbA n=1 Tax=Schleiferilactobacillus shenzhenensis LY-73 TaxID=1231336 RepID=U4TRP3_9LACO|nr:tRNA epoxyqueuosine(34) reductase QueG [Schleiferilactobacillus shenzhenensis]ERL64573.1 YhbA [Schleiferilactobacillus shenzhenensis LY-73]